MIFVKPPYKTRKEGKAWFKASIDTNDCPICGSQLGTNCKHLPKTEVHAGRLIPFNTFLIYEQLGFI